MRTGILLVSAQKKLKADNPELSNAKFIAWAEDNTPYGKRVVYDYLAVNKILHNSAKTVDKSIPFNTLKALTVNNVSDKVINDVLKRFTGNKKPPSTAEVKRIISASLPKTNIVFRENPNFAIRSERKGSIVVKPAYLLDVDKRTSIETVKILARYWKQQYHPDKEGGDADIFNRIVKAEAEIIKEKEIA